MKSIPLDKKILAEEKKEVKFTKSENGTIHVKASDLIVSDKFAKQLDAFRDIKCSK